MAVSTFLEVWGLQEQCRANLFLRALGMDWVIVEISEAPLCQFEGSGEGQIGEQLLVEVYC